jgi:hypothetical protein
MRGSPNTPSECGAHLKHRDNFTFHLLQCLMVRPSSSATRNQNSKFSDGKISSLLDLEKCEYQNQRPSYSGTFMASHLSKKTDALTKIISSNIFRYVKHAGMCV